MYSNSVLILKKEETVLKGPNNGSYPFFVSIIWLIEVILNFEETELIM